MAVKTNTKKTTTVKKVSAPKTKKRTTSGVRREIDKEISSLKVSHAEVRAEIKELARVVREAEIARKQDIEKREQERKEREIAREKERKELERIREKDNKETNEKINKLTENINQLTKNVDRVSNEVDRVSNEVDRLTQNIERVNAGIGGVRNTIGHIVEMVVLPGLSKKINEYGHKFVDPKYRHEFKRDDNSKFAEVDLYLEDIDEIMVVEAKTKFDDKGVNALLRRVERLRKNEARTGIAGKTIYAAAAGIEFTEEAEQMIKEKGIYQVTVNEENDKIIVAPLDIEDAGTW